MCAIKKQSIENANTLEDDSQKREQERDADFEVNFLEDN